MFKTLLKNHKSLHLEMKPFIVCLFTWTSFRLSPSITEETKKICLSAGIMLNELVLFDILNKLIT